MCVFVPKGNQILGYNAQEMPEFANPDGSAPFDLRGRLEELIAEYDNENGDISFGLKRHVPKGFPAQKTFWFPRIFRGVKRFMSEDARFFIAVRSPSGRAFR